MSNTPSQEVSESACEIPKVSVAMISYNHEKFITQAVESVVMQQTNFEYEVVIGEDCSTDNTRKILLDLQKKHPDRIKLLLHEQNLGQNGNLKQTLRACRGQYLAILEGDDYWISPDKLQKQVDALDQNPDWSICTHRITVFFEDGSQPSYLAPRFDPKPVSTLDDLSRSSFVGTSAAVYRKIPIDHYPEWIFEVTISDYALPLFYTQHGKIGFIDEVMCAYRKNTDSMWYPMDSLTQRTELARSLKIIAKNMAWQYRLNLENQAAQALLKIARTRLGDGQLSEARKVMGEIFRMPLSLAKLPRRRFVKMCLMIYFPWLIPVLYSVKSYIVKSTDSENI